MTNFRALSATTVAAAVVFALLLGAGPANAAPATNFPPTPIVPGPSVPPIPPGTVFRPVIQMPCPGALSDGEVAWAHAGYPTFHFQGASYNPAVTQTVPARIAVADPHRTCIYGRTGWPDEFTTVAITNADYTALTAWYHAHSTSSYQVAPGGQPGQYETMYIVDSIYNGNGYAEIAVISPDGWWINAIDRGDALLTDLMADATRQFLIHNPSRD